MSCVELISTMKYNLQALRSMWGSSKERERTARTSFAIWARLALICKFRQKSMSPLLWRPWSIFTRVSCQTSLCWLAMVTSETYAPLLRQKLTKRCRYLVTKQAIIRYFIKLAPLASSLMTYGSIYQHQLSNLSKLMLTQRKILSRWLLSLDSLRNSKTLATLVPHLLFYRLFKDPSARPKDHQIITIHLYSENLNKVTISLPSILNLVHQALTHSFNLHFNNSNKFNRFRARTQFRTQDKIGSN